MPRVKRGVTARARHKKVLAQAKGYRGRRSTVYRILAMTTGTVACGYSGTAYWGHLRKQIA